MFGNSTGLFGSEASPTPQSKPRSGLFGDPRRLAGIAGDFLAGLSGGQAVYGPMMAQRRAQEQAAQAQQQQAMQSREWANQDWHSRQDYSRAHPDPVEPTSMQRNYDWLRGTNPQAAEGYLAAQSRDPGDQFVTYTSPDGRSYAGPQSGFGAAMGGAPSAPVGRLTPMGETGPNNMSANAANNANEILPAIMPTPPRSVVNNEQLGALIAAHGWGIAQEWIRSGALQVRN